METINRKMESKIEHAKYPAMQLSVNSDDSLCIRFYNGYDKDNDCLMVFNSNETIKIVDFVKKYMIKSNVTINATLEKCDLPF